MPNQPSDLKSFLAAIWDWDFVVLDTETTGFDPSDEICDIAIIGSNRQVLLETLVQPVCPIYEEASRIHGITNQMVANAPNWNKISKEVAQLIKGKKVVTYNATFDRKMFHQSDKAHGIPETDWQGSSLWYCAMLAFAERFGEWNNYYGNYKYKKLVDAASFYHCDLRDSHRAISDAMTTLDVVINMKAEKLIHDNEFGDEPPL